MEKSHSIFRWLFAIGCFGIAFVSLKNGYQQMSPSILGFGLLLFFIGLGAIFSSLLAIACKPLFMLIDSIFFPGGKLNKPIKNIKLPAYYEKELRFDDALSEYEKVIRYYPSETLAYEGAIRVLINYFEDIDRATVIYTKSRRRKLVLSSEIDALFPAHHRG